MSQQQIFQPNQKVQIILHGKIIDTVTVVLDNRSEIEIENEHGNKSQFAYYSGWKLLFEGLGGERCYNPRGPTYEIKSVE